MMRAHLRCAECNMNDLQHIAEHEQLIAHEVVREGRQFFAFIQQRARGFSLEEANIACNKCDYELSLYRNADARRQQEQFSELQRTLRSSNEEEMARHCHNVRDLFQHEFRTELDSVKRELDLFQEANTKNDEEQARTLRDELLGANQRNSRSEQRLVAQLGEITDAVQRQEGTNYQLELRLEQVTSITSTRVGPCRELCDASLLANHLEGRSRNNAQHMRIFHSFVSRIDCILPVHGLSFSRVKPGYSLLLCNAISLVGST
eukprot:3546579-Amphidinium_carterae.3